MYLLFSYFYLQTASASVSERIRPLDSLPRGFVPGRVHWYTGDVRSRTPLDYAPSLPKKKIIDSPTQCDFRFDLFFSFSFVLVFLIFSF